jgi:hypothetical protein
VLLRRQIRLAAAGKQAQSGSRMTWPEVWSAMIFSGHSVALQVFD